MKSCYWIVGMFAAAGWCVCSVGLASAQSRGQSKTADLRVLAEVISNCQISTEDVNFGVYDPIVANRTTPKDATGKLHLQCTLNTQTKIELDNGQNAAGNQRAMLGGSFKLNYELYQDPAHTQRWGSAAEAKPFTGTGPGGGSMATAINVPGVLPAGQNVGAGSYLDTILVTVVF
jgi:spore coat protein U-like protein